MDVGNSYGGWHLVAHGAWSVGLQAEGTKVNMSVEFVLVFDVRDEAPAEGRHDMLAKHEPVMGDGQGFAVHRDILSLVALGEIGDCRVGRGHRRNGRLSGFDARDDVGGLLSGMVDGEVGVAMPAEADALGAAEGARLDDEDLIAGGIYSNAEAGKVAVPEDGVLAVDPRGGPRCAW